MGIAYDWVNQRLIVRKKKSESNTNRSSGSAHEARILCLGPIQTNLRQWHFSFRGAGDGMYSGGIYHGQIVLPKDYPMSPPSVQLWTPSGRFVPHQDICLSASNYHPESWTPRWSIHGIVNALRLHMLTRPMEIGGIESTAEVTKNHARRSLEWKMTWKVRGGNSGTKWTEITVDHQMMIQESVLDTAARTREEEEEADTDLDEIPVAEEGAIRRSASAETESGSESKRGAAVKPERESSMANRKNEHHSDGKIKQFANIHYPNDPVASMFHLVIMNYMAVFTYLNR